jgi:S-disulfanyl-L-cysteine oxidoreductase SoxD
MSTRKPGLGLWAGLFMMTSVATSEALAQMPTYGVGRAPTAEEVKAWDLTIPPDGQGLPPGRGTAVLGKPVYAERCAACHGENGEDPKYRALAGGRGPLTSAELSENLDWLLGGKPVLTIGRFWPYATSLWGYINRAQPFDEPGSLTHDQVYAVTAYLLYLNGIIGEADVLDAGTLPAVKMPNRNGFVPDSRPDVGRTTAPKKR